MVFPVLSLDILRNLRDNNGQFALELYVGGKVRNLDRHIRPDDRGRWLDKDCRRKVLSGLLEDLSHVVRVVTAQGNNLGGQSRGEQPHVAHLPFASGRFWGGKWSAGDFLSHKLLERGALRPVDDGKADSFWVSNSS